DRDAAHDDVTALEAESDTERMFALGGSLATLTVDLVVVFDSVNRNRMWVEREEGVDSCGFARSDAGSGTSRVAAFRRVFHGRATLVRPHRPPSQSVGRKDAAPSEGALARRRTRAPKGSGGRQSRGPCEPVRRCLEPRP